LERYIENWSLMLDLKILFMTVVHGLRHENAYLTCGRMALPIAKGGFP
jgi:hypothetical protein